MTKPVSFDAILALMSPDGTQVGLPALRAGRFLTNRALFHVGIGIFVLSFFLPTVNPYDLGDFDGFACAWLSLFALQDGISISALVFFGGLINPVAIAYVVLRILGRAPKCQERPRNHDSVLHPDHMAVSGFLVIQDRNRPHRLDHGNPPHDFLVRSSLPLAVATRERKSLNWRMNEPAAFALMQLPDTSCAAQPLPNTNPRTPAPQTTNGLLLSSSPPERSLAGRHTSSSFPGR